MFQNLSDKLDQALHSLKGHGKISEINVAETMKEIRRALLDADVSFKVAKEFTNRVKEKAIGEKVLTSLNPSQLLIKIVHDELAALMGSEESDIHLSGSMIIILIAGLQGSGKTTFSAKLANYLKKKKNKNVLLAAGDVYRPAAIDQLKILGEQIDIPVFSLEDSKDPLEIAKSALNHAKENKKDALIIDTAGRLAVDEEMMREISTIHKKINPSETLFVVDSMTGQDAVNTAKAFHEVLNYDGVVLTKLDGDTRGGAALTIKSVVDKPIKFISTGEKMEDMDVFYPNRMADRILGMGDVVSLVEKAQEQFDVKEAKNIQRKIAKNRFDFNDFLKQVNRIKRMGNMKDLLGMIPGAGKAVKNIDIDDDAFKGVEAIIYSMTPYERENPGKIDISRKRRIAKGSGTNIKEVNQLIKQFGQMGKMMKSMQSGRGKNIMQGLGEHKFN